MKKNAGNTDRRLLGAIDYIDDRFIAEAAEKIKPRNAGKAAGVASKTKSFKYLALLAACLLLLGAVIPMVSYIIRNHLNISGIHETTGDDTTLVPEVTSEEITTSPDSETSEPADETTAEETTEEETTEEETTEEETTEEETTEEETTAEETTAEETTTPPEPEYDGSRGLKYKISDDGKYAKLVGIGTCTDKDIVVASSYMGYPVKYIGWGRSRKMLISGAL